MHKLAHLRTAVINIAISIAEMNQQVIMSAIYVLHNYMLHVLRSWHLK